uniref:Uncharacterized protein n=1 Tax=Pristionchus pacificus TaxID=54126 RepID=A0A2A6B6F6_PRIPA|eukprot:PDM61448.1 hypothetical protein PRIPAC_50890 [Pristionchus pacificus]
MRITRVSETLQQLLRPLQSIRPVRPVQQPHQVVLSIGQRAAARAAREAARMPVTIERQQAPVAAEVVGVPEAIDGHDRLVPDRRIAQRAQTTYLGELKYQVTVT